MVSAGPDTGRVAPRVAPRKTAVFRAVAGLTRTRHKTARRLIATLGAGQDHHSRPAAILGLPTLETGSRVAAGWEPFTVEGIKDTVSVEPTTAKRFHENAERANDNRAPATDRGDGPLWHWVERYAPADRPTQRALHRACRSALHRLGGELNSPEAARLTPRIVERTIDRYLAQLLGVAEPRGRVARARLKVHAMTLRRAPVDRPAADGLIAPVSMAAAGPHRRAAPSGRLQPANANPGPTRAPASAPLLPPEAPLEMPEQDLS